MGACFFVRSSSTRVVALFTELAKTSLMVGGSLIPIRSGALPRGGGGAVPCAPDPRVAPWRLVDAFLHLPTLVQYCVVRSNVLCPHPQHSRSTDPFPVGTVGFSYVEPSWKAVRIARRTLAAESAPSAVAPAPRPCCVRPETIFDHEFIPTRTVSRFNNQCSHAQRVTDLGPDSLSQCVCVCVCVKPVVSS